MKSTAIKPKRKEKANLSQTPFKQNVMEKDFHNFDFALIREFIHKVCDKHSISIDQTIDTMCEYLKNNVVVRR
jgi:hypothetical protein